MELWERRLAEAQDRAQREGGRRGGRKGDSAPGGRAKAAAIRHRTAARDDAIGRLAVAGVSQRRIAAALGVSRGCVVRVLRRNRLS